MHEVLAEAEKVPARQATHIATDDAAAVVEYVPAGHCKQPRDDVRPEEVEKNPAGQGKHC